MQLSAIATREVFSAAHARELGIGSSALRRFVQAGRAFPLHRGWYAVRPPRDEKDRHLLRTTALLQEYAGHALTSHGSAVLWLGLPTERIDFGTVHLMWVGPETTFRSYSRVRMHESIESSGLRHGREAVDPALAVVQAGLFDVRSLLVAGDAALGRGLVSPERLRSAAAALKGQRGLIQARAAIGWCDERHESPGESLTAHVLRTLGYGFEPQFEPGPTGPGGQPLRVDFRIAGTRVLVEFDGKEKYQAGTEDEAQRLLFAEKRREDEIRRHDYEVVRLTWADLHRPDRVRALIEAAILRSRRRAG